MAKDARGSFSESEIPFVVRIPFVLTGLGPGP